MDKPAELEDRLVDFAVRIINVVEALSCYFTNQQSSIVNHQSNERAGECLQRSVNG